MRKLSFCSCSWAKISLFMLTLASLEIDAKTEVCGHKQPCYLPIILWFNTQNNEQQKCRNLSRYIWTSWMDIVLKENVTE